MGSDSVIGIFYDWLIFHCFIPAVWILVRLNNFFCSAIFTILPARYCFKRLTVQLSINGLKTSINFESCHLEYIILAGGRLL
jgi:hypothetical protein